MRFFKKSLFIFSIAIGALLVFMFLIGFAFRTNGNGAGFYGRIILFVILIIFGVVHTVKRRRKNKISKQQ